MQQLQNLSAINTNSIEGRYLMAALAKISGESQTDKQPDEILEQCGEMVEKMYADNPLPDFISEPKTFKQQLSELINRNNKESGSDTPDYILADYLNACLETYDKTVRERDEWFGIKSMFEQNLELK